jgi:hypothetical protein
MGKTLTEIAQQLRDADKKVQLIYAFNGSGKTRLSREFKRLIAPKANGGQGDDEPEPSEPSRSKILYYNAFTEDLFYWDNDLTLDAEPKLRSSPTRSPTGCSRFAAGPRASRPFSAINAKLTSSAMLQRQADADFSEDFFPRSPFPSSAATTKAGQPQDLQRRRELLHLERLLYAAGPGGRHPQRRRTGRSRNRSVRSAGICVHRRPGQLAGRKPSDRAGREPRRLIKKQRAQLRFVITTHSPLFYNVLHNELSEKASGKVAICWSAWRMALFNLNTKYGDSNRSFSYHLHLKKALEAGSSPPIEVQRYHFTLLRNLYEKTASFLGYQQWSDYCLRTGLAKRLKKPIAESKNFIVLDRYTRAWKVGRGLPERGRSGARADPGPGNQGYEFLPGLNTPEALLANVRVQLQRSTMCSFRRRVAALRRNLPGQAQRRHRRKDPQNPRRLHPRLCVRRWAHPEHLPAGQEEPAATSCR